MKTTTQNKLVIRWLQSGETLTAKQSADYWGIYRLSARIYDLKRQGHAIKSELKFDGSCHWSSYSIEKP